jgi:hypothetical protein
MSPGKYMHVLEIMCKFFFYDINLRVQNKIVRAKTLTVWWYIYHIEHIVHICW